MSRTRLLGLLSEAGLDNGDAYDQGLDGWFGWEIVGDVLEVRFENSDEGEMTIYRWRLESLGG